MFGEGEPPGPHGAPGGWFSGQGGADSEQRQQVLPRACPQPPPPRTLATAYTSGLVLCLWPTVRMDTYTVSNSPNLCAIPWGFLFTFGLRKTASFTLRGP